MCFSCCLFTADAWLNDVSPAAETGDPVGNDLANADNEVDFFDQAVNVDWDLAGCLS
jgi:hypothetical protein